MRFKKRLSIFLVSLFIFQYVFMSFGSYKSVKADTGTYVPYIVASGSSLTAVGPAAVAVAPYALALGAVLVVGGVVYANREQICIEGTRFANYLINQGVDVSSYVVNGTQLSVSNLKTYISSFLYSELSASQVNCTVDGDTISYNLPTSSDSGYLLPYTFSSDVYTLSVTGVGTTVYYYSDVDDILLTGIHSFSIPMNWTIDCSVAGTIKLKNSSGTTLGTYSGSTFQFKTWASTAGSSLTAVVGQSVCFYPKDVETSVANTASGISDSIDAQMGSSTDIALGGDIDNYVGKDIGTLSTDGTVTKSGTNTGTSSDIGSLFGDLWGWLQKIIDAIKSIPSLLQNIWDWLKTAISSLSLDLSVPSSATLDFSPVEVAFSEKFPFSIPWDFVNGIKALSVDAVSPEFDIVFPKEMIPGGASFKLDFQQFGNVTAILKYFILISYVYGLFVLTKKLKGDS